MTPEQLAEIEQRADDVMDYGGATADEEQLAGEDVPALVAEVKRLTAELELAFSPGMYLDIQKVLDEALGTKESDGAGAGIVADVALLADRMKTALAERDADRAEIVQLCQERLQLTAERDSLKGLLSGSQQELRDAIAAQGKAEQERDEARAGWTKAVEIATEASSQRDQALAALETAVDALRSGT